MMDLYTNDSITASDRLADLIVNILTARSLSADADDRDGGVLNLVYS